MKKLNKRNDNYIIKVLKFMHKLKNNTLNKCFNYFTTPSKTHNHPIMLYSL